MYPNWQKWFSSFLHNPESGPSNPENLASLSIYLVLRVLVTQTNVWPCKSLWGQKYLVRGWPRRTWSSCRATPTTRRTPLVSGTGASPGTAQMEGSGLLTSWKSTLSGFQREELPTSVIMSSELLTLTGMDSLISRSSYLLLTWHLVEHQNKNLDGLFGQWFICLSSY